MRLPAWIVSVGPVPLVGAAPELTSVPTTRLFWKMWTPEINGIVTSTVSGVVSDANVAS